jgi:hypothetical protein
MEKTARQLRLAATETTEKMLDDEFEAYSKLIAEGTLERNLDSARVGDKPASTSEKQLEDKKKGAVRGGVVAELTESRLNSGKSRQNTSGNIPKLEEKRLSGSPVEKETSKKAHN